MAMKKLKILVSLTTDDNDYQREQLIEAEEAARQLDVDVQIIHANNDVIQQSQQLLEIIQSSSASRPDAIVLEPVGGAGLPRVALAAASAGIGWVVLNCDVDYVGELRKTSGVPAFAITSDHVEIGRIQGRQFGALLPEGGSVLYIQGPSTSSAAQQRTIGMHESKPGNLQIKTLRGQWTEGSACESVSSWLRLPTSRPGQIDLVGCQDDSMALGARRAFQQQTKAAERAQWLTLPFTGVDGLPREGQAWVRQGGLAATITVPANTGLALEMLAGTLRNAEEPPERTLTTAKSYPEIDAIAARQRRQYLAHRKTS